MNELFVVGVLLTGVVAVLLGLAPLVSESLVRARARRLPRAFSERMSEEWLAELEVLPGRASQLVFAVALALTRRHSFGIDDDGSLAAPSRPSMTFGTFNGWPAIVTLTTIVMAACAYGVSFLIPPLYQAHALMRVIPALVPEQYVQRTSRVPVAARVQYINDLVLSHTYLARVILELDLYPAMRLAGSRSMPDDVITRMRQDISLEVGTDGRTIDVAYVSQQPRTAQKVVERLTASYITQSGADGANAAEATKAFLDAQVEDVRARVLKQAVLMHSMADTDPSQAALHILEHQVLQSTYRDLLMKEEQAKISRNLDVRQMGAKFHIVDAGRLPETPISPNRPLIGGVGAAVGFCLGLGMMLAGRNRPFRRPKNVLVQS